MEMELQQPSCDNEGNSKSDTCSDIFEPNTSLYKKSG